MAFQGKKHGYFIHVPKCGGSYIKRVLHQSPLVHQEKAHALPKEWNYSGKTRYWNTVRHPAVWMRSVWRNRHGESFRPFPHPEVPWHLFCEMTNPLASNDFEEFVSNLCTHLSGILTWMHKVYSPPPVKVIRLDMVDVFLKELGFNPDPIIIPNKGPNLPEISEDIYEMIYLAEKNMYHEYGYGVFPDENEFKKWRQK